MKAQLRQTVGRHLPGCLSRAAQRGSHLSLHYWVRRGFAEEVVEFAPWNT
jgi:hypothetical protein